MIELNEITSQTAVIEAVRAEMAAAQNERKTARGGRNKQSWLAGYIGGLNVALGLITKPEAQNWRELDY